MRSKVGQHFVNDDPDCRSRQHCYATGKGLCRDCAIACGKLSAARKKALADPAVRAKMSAARKKAWAEKTRWHPPSGTEILFEVLRKKVGPTEARRLVEDHALAKGIGLPAVEAAA